MQGAIVLAFIFNFVTKRRYTAWWEEYAYVLTRSLNAAIGISGLAMYFAVQHPAVVLDWWGDRARMRVLIREGLLELMVRLSGVRICRYLRRVTLISGSTGGCGIRGCGGLLEVW